MTDIRARNADRSDREVLTIIDRIANSDGYVTSTEVALALGITTNGKKSRTPATRIASRLAWMRRYGFLESEEPDYERPYTEPGSRDTRWRLTPVGRALMKGSLSKTLEKQIEEAAPGQQLLLMRHITRRAYVEGIPQVAAAIRREYQHTTAQRTKS